MVVVVTEVGISRKFSITSISFFTRGYVFFSSTYQTDFLGSSKVKSSWLFSSDLLSTTLSGGLEVLLEFFELLDLARY